MIAHYTDMDELFESPRGSLRLGRHEEEQQSSLRAWDAADEFALAWIEENPAFARGAADRKGPFVLNDSFGSLTLGLADLGPRLVTDSFLSAEAVKRNAAANGGTPENLKIYSPLDALGESAAFAVVKIPKSLALLEFELLELRKHLLPGAFVLGEGMTREIHRSTLNLFETLLGPTTTSLAKKKARLVFCRPREETDSSKDGGGASAGYPRTLEDAATGLSLVLHAGVFSQGGIDAGTRLLLGNLPEGEPKRIIDLGCGSGVIGLAAALRYPGSGVDLTDESRLAAESARLTFRLNGLEGRGRYFWGDGLRDFSEGAADLILCNPPFHGRREVSLASAFAMFRDAFRVLRPGGEFRLAANSHLGYRGYLAALFGAVHVIKKTEKFILYSCKKR